MINKLLNKVYVGAALLCSVLAASSCTAGLTYEEAPESVYSEVGVSGFVVRSRELFTDKIYAPNWDKWVDNYIDTRQVGNTSFDWTNNTGSSYILPDGTVVKAGETIKGLGAGVTEEIDTNAPDGKVYILNVFATSQVKYQTANKGYLFDGSKFSGDYKLVDPVDNRSQYVIMPVKKNEVIGEINLVDVYNCTVEPVDGAPKLGIPADFTKPHRYLVRNISYLPAGVEQYKRLYEVRVTFLP